MHLEVLTFIIKNVTWKTCQDIHQAGISWLENLPWTKHHCLQISHISIKYFVVKIWHLRCKSWQQLPKVTWCHMSIHSIIVVTKRLRATTIQNNYIIWNSMVSMGNIHADLVEIYNLMFITTDDCEEGQKLLCEDIQCIALSSFYQLTTPKVVLNKFYLVCGDCSFWWFSMIA